MIPESATYKSIPTTEEFPWFSRAPPTGASYLMGKRLALSAQNPALRSRSCGRSGSYAPAGVDPTILIPAHQVVSAGAITTGPRPTHSESAASMVWPPATYWTVTSADGPAGVGGGLVRSEQDVASTESSSVRLPF